MAAAADTAAELFAQMFAAYAAAPSYADRGTAFTAGTQRVEFRTSFVRGTRFRFEFQYSQTAQVIWSDGIHTYAHWPGVARIGRPEMLDYGADIGLAIAAATGVSSGTAYTVPTMLLPVSIGPSVLAKTDELRLDGLENIDGHMCARVFGSGQQAGPTVVWIDCETHLLRRIRERFDSFETTTSYEPTLHPIDVSSIERPDIEKTPPVLKGPTPWTGIHLKVASKCIDEIFQDSPAVRSGLAIGDEIEAVNGQRMPAFVDVMRALRSTKIADDIALTIRRGSNSFDVALRVEAVPSQPRAAPTGPLID